MRDLLGKLRASEFCQRHDLVDPITMLMATGLRRSELLGLRWQDYDVETGTITVAGKVARFTGKGLAQFSQTKTAAGARTFGAGRCGIRTISAEMGVWSGIHSGCPT